jgi:hypothetical protein
MWVRIICVSLTKFPEPPAVLASMCSISLNPTMILQLGVYNVIMIMISRQNCNKKKSGCFYRYLDYYKSTSQ